MNDLSNKGLAINNASATEAGETGFSTGGQQSRSSEQLERGEASLNQKARAPIPVGDTDPTAKLFSGGEAGSLRSRWENIQVGFVDEPKRSVKEADQLVAAVLSHLAEGFTTERQRLQSQWDRNDDVSTEDLRCSFRRYRSIFERLLAI
jgi:hypothetical protein